MSTLQNSWGDDVHVYKFDQGGVWRGILSYTRKVMIVLF